MSEWWQGLEPVEAALRCGGATHHVRWSRGELSAPDHSDLEGERALSALGGEPCACVEVLDAWARYAADERVLVAASRGPWDRIPAREWSERDEEPAQTGWFSYGPVTSFPMPFDTHQPDGELLSLLALPGRLGDRLVATVAAGCITVSPRLHAALHGRVAGALGVWLGRSGVELSLTLGDVPALTRDDAGGVHAQLPFRWLSDVWARDLTSVLGRFVMSASTDDGRAWELLAVGVDFGAPERLRLAF